MAKITEASEIRRLKRIYKGMEPNQLKVVDGLIVEAARLRVRLDYLWHDYRDKQKLSGDHQAADGSLSAG